MIVNPISLLNKQTQAWDSLEHVESKIDSLGYGGGAGGGKTELGCKLAIFIATQFAGSSGVIGRFELKNLKQTTLASFFKVAAKLGLKQKMRGVKDWDFDYNQQEGVIRFNNEIRENNVVINPPSIIITLDTAPSPKDPLYTRFGGLELSWGWIDESNETPYQAIDILATRIGRNNNNPLWKDSLKKYFGMYDEKDGWILRPFLLETFNPEKNHIYRRFWKPYKLGKMPENRKFIKALATDNPFLPQAYIERLLRSSKATIERLFHGNFDYDDDPTKIMEYDKITDIFSNTHVKGGEHFLTGDIAGKGKDRTVLYVWEGFKVIHIHFEEWTDQKDLRKTIERLKEEYSIPTSNIVLDYDGIGVGIVDELECKGFQNGSSAVSSPQEKLDGLKANYKNLRSQCWFLFADKVNKNEIYVKTEDEKIKEWITEELDVIKEINDGLDKPRQIIPKGGSKDDAAKVTIKSLLGRSPDFGDGLMMRMYFELPFEAEPNIRMI